MDVKDVACAGRGPKATRPDLTPWPEIRPDFRVETLRMRMHEYSITFAADVDLAATAIERRAADSAVRRNALLCRVRAIPTERHHIRADISDGPLRRSIASSW